MVARIWPQARAALALVHVVGVLILATPSPDRVADPRRFRSERAKRELELWTRQLDALGWRTTPAELEADLLRVGRSYVAVRTPLAAPFSLYARCCGVGQNWAMFPSPNYRPAALSIELDEGAGWRRIYFSRTAAEAWRAEQFDHNRMRKIAGRIAREPWLYDALVAWIAREAARDFPEARRVRVGLYTFESLPPERVRAGERPIGSLEQVRIVPLETR